MNERPEDAVADEQWQVHVAEAKKHIRRTTRSDIIYFGGLLGAVLAPVAFYYPLATTPGEQKAWAILLYLWLSPPGAATGAFLAWIIRSIFEATYSRKR
jgi:hypothetical protein